MTTLQDSMTAHLKRATRLARQGFDLVLKVKFLWVSALALGLGILLGQAMQSAEQATLTVSIVVVLAIVALCLYRPLAGMLVWLFFIPFLETRIKIPMGAGIPDLSFSRFVIAFLSISMLARAAVGKLHFERIGATEIAILAVAIGIMIAAPLSTGPTGVLQMALALYLTPLTGYFFAKNLVKNRRQLHQVFMTIALLGFVSGAYAAYEHATGNILFLAEGREATELMLVRRELGIRIIRGIWGGTGSMGRALAISIPITFYLLLETRNNSVRRALLVGMLLTQCYGIVIAMSRTPWFALLGALFVMQLVYPKFRRLFVVILIVAALSIGLTWDRVADSDVAARLGDDTSTLTGRQTRWQAGFAMWQVKPIRGWGFGRYQEESGRFRSDGLQGNIEAVESDYLYTLVGSGLIGFVPYVLALLLPFINSLKLFGRCPSSQTQSSEGPGFITRETIAVYWAVLLVFVVGSYTAKETMPGIRLMVFTMAGAVVGTHEYLLRRPVRSSLARHNQQGQQAVPGTTMHAENKPALT
jgi:O-antigen ligase